MDGETQPVDAELDVPVALCRELIHNGKAVVAPEKVVKPSAKKETKE